MPVPLIAVPAWRVNSKVHGTTVLIGQCLGVALHQVQALFLRQFGRERHLMLSSHTGILPTLGGLSRIPQFGSARLPVSSSRQNDPGRGNTPSTGVVEDLPRALIMDQFSSPIGRRRRRRATRGAGKRFDGEVINGHGGIR